MALSDKDRKEIQGWIQNGIPGERKGKKVTRFIKEWGLTGVAGGLFIFFLTQWGGYIQFRTHTQDKLEQIDKDIQGISLKVQAASPLADFQATLPSLKTSLESAKKNNIKIAPATINTLQSKMRETSDTTAGYWPAASALINYHSFSALSLSDLQDLTRPDLQECLAKLPETGRITVIQPSAPGKTGSITASGSHYYDCKITLDSPHDNAVLNDLILHFNTLIVFKHCLVIYRGGPVNLIIRLQNYPVTVIAPSHPQGVPTVVSGSTITFQDCLFQLDITASPPPIGAKITQLLLAENNLSSINLQAEPQSK